MSQPILQKDTLRRHEVFTEETPILHSPYKAYKTPHSQTEEKEGLMKITPTLYRKKK